MKSLIKESWIQHLLFLLFFIGCGNNKEVEMLEASIDKYEFLLHILIPISILLIVIFSLIGMLIGSKTRRDNELQKKSQGNNDEPK
jgi:hypothetical protein